MWTPDLATATGARYRAIVDALTADVERGRLRDGDRLPTHRDLAYRLGVTVGTVTRAYTEAERRGLVQGEVGRGTYVRRQGLRSTSFMMDPATTGAAPIDLSLNYPARSGDEALFAAALNKLAASNELGSLLEYQPHRGMAQHRAAGAEWVGHAGMAASPEQVIVTAGAQHAMTVAFAGLTQPGDVVLSEALTYPGMKAAANLLRLRLHGVAMDGHGVLPEAFEAACRAQRPKALYCMPNIQNPTGALMPEARRREIAAIARKHRVAVVEDDIYSFLLDETPPPLASLAGELGYYLTSVSKCIAPGLRTGFLVVPPGPQANFAAAVRTTMWMASPLSAELTARWLVDGTAMRQVEAHRAEAIIRQEMARARLTGFDYAAHPRGYHGWLTLPPGWLADDFTAQARQKGVLLTAAEAFAVSRPTPHAVRLCLGAARSRGDLNRALDIVAELLQAGPQAQLSVV